MALQALQAFDDMERFVQTKERLTASPHLKLSLCAPGFTGNERVTANIRALLASYLKTEVEVTLTSGFEGLDQLRSAKPTRSSPSARSTPLTPTAYPCRTPLPA